MKTPTCFVALAMLAGLTFDVLTHQAVMAEEKDHRVVASREAVPDPDPRPVHGGLRGIVSPTDEGAGWQPTDLDRARMRRGVEAYVAEFGPLSRSDDHSGFAGVSPSRLSFYPFGGRAGVDFNLHNFFDHASQVGGIQDWNCGDYTADGVIATMGLVPTFDRQLIGIPVYAALDGVVVTTHDGEDDQNVEYEEGRPTNFVRLDHGQGLQTSCFLLRKDSILVSPGDEVRAGQQIAEAAASGNTDWPALAFATLMDEALFDPFVGPCNEGESAWAEQPGIPDINDVTFTDFGVTLENLDAYFAYPENHRWQPPAEGYVPLDHDGIWMWVRGLNLPANSTCTFRFYDPAGDLHYDSGWFWLNFGLTSYRFWNWWFYWDIPGMQQTPGTWRVNVFVNGQLQLAFPLDIVAEGDPTPNRPPSTITSALIRPNDPTLDDVLVCEVNSAGPLDDLDWDIVRYRYTWSVGGRVLRDTVSAGLADFLPASLACEGAVVECRVTPSDGLVDGTVVTAMVEMDGPFSGDADCDGILDCPGDFNHDGHRNGGDLGSLLAWWGTPGGDINGDGTTNGADLGLFLGYWGDC